MTEKLFISAYAFGHTLELAPSKRNEFPDTLDFSIYGENYEAGKENTPLAICLTNLPNSLSEDELIVAMNRIIDIIETQPYDDSLHLTKDTWKKIMDLDMSIFESPTQKKRRTACDSCMEGNPKFPDVKCCFNCDRDNSKCGVWHNCGEDCCGWEMRKDAITEENWDLTKRREIHKLAYDRYVMWWLTDQGYSVADIAEIAMKWQVHKEEYAFFDTYIRCELLDRNGVAPDSYWAFLKAPRDEASYRNTEFMRALLHDDEFSRYQADIATL